MTQSKAILGAMIFDGTQLFTNHCLMVAPDGTIRISQDQKAVGLQTVTLVGGVIMPGFVDLQVNGGGGVMFNDAPGVSALRQIAQAHARCGTAAFLPTLITDTKPKTQAAINAAVEAIAQGVTGIIGLHLEGPHLDPMRKGAHDAGLIRPMDQDDLTMLEKAADKLPNLMVTLAPENVTDAQIKTLAKAGVVVSLGHSNCTYERAMQAFDAGARLVTHLFNAMSQMAGRAPGLVGAALTRGTFHAGLIADAVHVHPATMRMAIAANPTGIFLVSDAMATAGSDITSFALDGREITRSDGRLTLADGTLAGADLTLGRAIQVLVQDVGIPLEQALAMATSTPSSLLARSGSAGTLGTTLDGLIHLDIDSAAVQPLGRYVAKAALNSD